MRVSSCRAAVAALLGAHLARAFIPAVAVNDTSVLVNSDDRIHITWLPNGVYRCVSLAGRRSLRPSASR